MTKLHTILILGIVLTIVPFLGVPTSWKTFLNVFLGFLIAFFSYSWIRKLNYHIDSSHGDALNDTPKEEPNQESGTNQNPSIGPANSFSKDSYK